MALSRLYNRRERKSVSPFGSIFIFSLFIKANIKHFYTMKKIISSLLVAAALLLPHLTVAQTPVTDTILVGDTTNMSLGGGMPYQYLSASYTQQMVLASELDGAALITGIDFLCGNASYVGRQCTIYLANTYYSRLDSFVPFGAQFQQVAVAFMGTTEGWVHINFDNPFYYNGFGNLVVAIDSPYGTGGDHYCEQTQTISRYVGINLENLSPTIPSQSTTYRNIMRFHTQAIPAPPASCPSPVMDVVQVGDSSVTVASGSWGTNSGGWLVECISDGDAAWHEGDLMGGDTSYTMTGLIPNTHYTFRFTNFCSDTTIYAYRHILTSCNPTTVPLTENFDSSWYLPDCWYAAPGSAGGRPSIVSNYSHSASHSVKAQGGSLVLPPFDVPVDSLELSFWSKNGTVNPSLDLYVGVVIDPLDFSTFTPVDTVVATGWNPAVVRFDRYTGLQGRLAIRTANPVMTYMYIDDIEVNRISPCQTIMTVTSDQITDTSALVHWVDTMAANFEVAYGPSGFTIDTSYIVYNIHADSLLLDDLLPYTTYDVYVRSLCSGAYTNWSPVHSFRTFCSLLDTLPYTEDFDSYTGHPYPSELPCWRGRVAANTIVVDVSGGSHSGSQALRWEWSPYETVVDQYAVLPAVNATALPLNMLQLSFWAKNNEDTYNLYDEARLVVGVMTDPGDTSTFQPLDTVNIVGDNWYRYDVPLSDYRGTGRFVTIRSCRGMAGLNHGWYALIDDINLDLISPCPSVTGVTLTGLTASSATIRWDSYDTTAVWQTFIDTVATKPTDVDTAHLTTASQTFDGLVTGTTHYIWVRAICPLKNDTSDWEGPLQVVPGVWNMRANKNDTLTMCGVTLYDNGGSDAIFSTQHSKLVIHPDMPGHLVSISGMCNIGTSASFIIYDGVGTSGPVLWTKAVNTGQFTFNFGPVISETGSLTLDFEARFMENREGFEFQVSCIPDTCIVHHLQLDTAVAATDSTLALSWDCNGSSLYEVEYGPVGFIPGTGTLATTTDNSFVITGLTSLDRREIYVRSLCSEGDTSAWVRGIFATEPCSDALFRDNFDSTMAYNDIPTCPVGYNGYYSYAQTLVEPAFLAGLEQGITALAFRPSSYIEGDHMNNVTVWLANVSDTSLNDGFLLRDADHHFVKVIDSANFCHTATTQWQPLHFDRPFLWDGHSSLLIAVLCEDGGDGTRIDYSGHYKYSDFVNGISRSYQVVGYFPIDIDSARTYNQPYYSAYGSFITGDLRLFTNTCDMPVCNAPVIDSLSGDRESITLSWQGMGSTYQLTISPDPSGIGLVSTSDNSYTFTSLQPSTTYYISLRQDCSADTLGYSTWTHTQFSTPGDTTGIGDTPFTSLHSPLTVYPNPTTSRVTIQSPGTLTTAYLTDMMGRRKEVRLIPEGNSSNYTYTLDLTAYPRGAYFLILTTTDGQQHTLRLIKQSSDIRRH